MAPLADRVADLLTFSRDADAAALDRHHLARAASAGGRHRVSRGSYVDDEVWRAADERERYLLRIHASARTRQAPPVLSHWSAAAVHALPIIGHWPRDVHRLMERTSGGRSRNGVIAHPVRLDRVDIVEVHGLLVTSVARTVVDLAATSSFGSAVTTADHVLHRKRPGHLELDALRLSFEAAQPKAHQRALAVLEFATDRSDAPSESISRVNMHLGGFEAPRLQSPFSDRAGYIGDADFEWPSVGLLGEADGKVKYLKDEYLAGRHPGEIVYAEKLREDRLRALPRRVTRWPWDTALRLDRLAAHLRAAGAPLRSR